MGMTSQACQDAIWGAATNLTVALVLAWPIKSASALCLQANTGTTSACRHLSKFDTPGHGARGSAAEVAGRADAGVVGQREGRIARLAHIRVLTRCAVGDRARVAAPRKRACINERRSSLMHACCIMARAAEHVGKHSIVSHYLRVGHT